MTTVEYQLRKTEIGFKVVASGALGPRGPQGPAGGKWVMVTGTPQAGDGDDSDWAFNPTSGLVWGPKASGQWPAPVGSLKGPPGEPGEPGSGEGAELSDEVPLPLGEASPGDGTRASGDKHVHAMPALGDLTDVELSSPTDGQVPTWQGDRFINQTPPGGGGGGGSGGVENNDPRLSDSRTPKPHAASHAANGSDPVTPASIGAVPSNDSRLTDQRTPKDASVTSGKLDSSIFGTASDKVRRANDAAYTDERTPKNASVTRAKLDPSVFGAVAGSVTDGADPRLSDQRTPGDASVTPAKLHASVFGTTSTTVPRGNDPRLSDDRTPKDASVTAAKLAAGLVGTGDGQIPSATDPRITGAQSAGQVAAQIDTHNSTEGAHGVWLGTTPPPGTSEADWVVESVVRRRAGGRDAWVKPSTVADQPNTLPPDDTPLSQQIDLGYQGIRAEYLLEGGVLTSGLDPDVVTSAAVALMLDAAAIEADQQTYDALLGWLNTNLKRSLPGASTSRCVGLYGTSKNLDANTTVWTVNTADNLIIAAAVVKAWNLWGRASDRDLASVMAGELKAIANTDEGRAYLPADELQQQVTNGHHNSAGHPIFKVRLSGATDFTRFRMLKTFTGDQVFDNYISGGRDLVAKTTQNGGPLATAVGLPPEFVGYDGTDHTVHVIATGQVGWSETQTTDFTLDAARVVENLRADKDIFGQDQSRDWLAGAIKTFYTARMSSAGKVVDRYTHTGTAVGSDESATSYRRAQMSLTMNDPSNSTAAGIESKIADLATNSYGRYIPDQIEGVTAVSSRDRNLRIWHAVGYLIGRMAVLAAYGSNPNAGTATPPGSTPPGGGGGGTVVIPPTTMNVPTATYGLAIDPYSQILTYAAALPAGPVKERFLWAGNQPMAQWVGDWDEDGSGLGEALDRSETAGKVLDAVSYRIPGRDIGQYSAGGAANETTYRLYIENLAVAIGDRQCRMAYEPDSITHASELSPESRAGRIAVMTWAIGYLKANCPNLWLYVDVGHSAWKSVDDAASLLAQVHVEQCNGFAINISNFRSDSECIAYGQAILAKLNIPHLRFIFDSSRNGNPAPPGDWANPMDRQLGRLPYFGNQSGIAGCDGWGWFKRPGESDGSNWTALGQAPNAGEFFPPYMYNFNTTDNGNLAGMLQRPPTPGVGSLGGGSGGGIDPGGPGSSTPIPVQPGDHGDISDTELSFYAFGFPADTRDLDAIAEIAVEKLDDYIDYTWTTTGAGGFGRISVPDQAQFGQSGGPSNNQFMIGTISVTNGSNVVTGSGTSFTSQLVVGQTIGVPGDYRGYKVASIVNNTQLTLEATIQSATASNVQWQRGGGSFSEGVAYGACDLAYASRPGSPLYRSDAKDKVDALIGYWEAHSTGDYTMHWKQNPDGSTSGTGGATDADEDMAWALIIMDRIHGSAGAVNYKQKAINLCNAMLEYEFTSLSQNPPFTMTNGDQWGINANRYMPDYFAPAWYREFARYTNQPKWIDIVQANYPRAVGHFLDNFTTGYVPDQCDRNGNSIESLAPGSYRYGYNSVRYPWRIILDYLLHGTPLAKTAMDRLCSTQRTLSGDNPSNTRAEVALDGSSNGGYTNIAFVAGYALAGLASSSNSDWVNDCVTYLNDSSEVAYFGQGLQVLSLITMIGEWKTYRPAGT